MNPRRTIWFSMKEPPNKNDIWLTRSVNPCSDDSQETTSCKYILKMYECGQWIPIGCCGGGEPTPGPTPGPTPEESDFKVSTLSAVSTSQPSEPPTGVKCNVYSQVSGNNGRGIITQSASQVDLWGECTVEAIPDEHSMFKYWTDENLNKLSEENPYTFHADKSDIFIYGNLELEKHVVNTYPINNTSRSLSQQGGEVLNGGVYTYGHYLTLKAVPYQGYRVAEWKGSDNQVLQTGGTKYSFEVTEDTDVYVVFEDSEFNVSVEYDQNEFSVSGIGSYTCGETCTITVTEIDTKRFVALRNTDGQVLTTEPEYTFNVYEDVDLVVEMAEQQQRYTVRTIVQGYGSLIGSNEFPCVFNRGEVCDITATPDDGYTFVGFQENGITISQEMRLQFPVTSDRTITGVFEQKTNPDVYDVSGIVQDEFGNTVDCEIDGLGKYNSGDTCKIHIKSFNQKKYYIDTITVKDTVIYQSQDAQYEMVDNSCEFVVDRDSPVIVVLGTIQYNVNVTLYDEVNALNPFECEVLINEQNVSSHSFSYGDTCTLRAVPKGDRQFKQWGYTVHGQQAWHTGSVYSFTVIDNAEVTAHFIMKSNLYTIRLDEADDPQAGYLYMRVYDVVENKTYRSPAVVQLDYNKRVEITAVSSNSDMICQTVHMNGEPWPDGESGYVNNSAKRTYKTGIGGLSGKYDYQFKPIFEGFPIKLSIQVQSGFIGLCNVGFDARQDYNRGNSSMISRYFPKGDEVTIYAYPGEGYQFIRWEDVSGRPVSYDQNYTFTIQKAVLYTATFRNSQSGGEDMVQGQLSGKFTVNSGGDVVSFSQGNLQYQALTNTWRFAENQWNYCGGYRSVGETYTSPSEGDFYEDGLHTVYENTGNVDDGDNIGISSTNDKWIDLFGWGTSGYQHRDYYYHPYELALDAVGDVSPGNPRLLQNTRIGRPYVNITATPSLSVNEQTGSWYNLTNQDGTADWGYNRISNGGNQENMWHTLLESEYEYLLFTRDVPSGIRFAKGQIRFTDTYVVQGLLLFPDDWNASYYNINNPNDKKSEFKSNDIPREEFLTLQGYGVVFLPVTGVRWNTNQQGGDPRIGYISGAMFQPKCGFYWTSGVYKVKLNAGAYSNNPIQYAQARYLFIGDKESLTMKNNDVAVVGTENCSYGQAVRLVRNVQNDSKRGSGTTIGVSAKGQVYAKTGNVEIIERGFQTSSDFDNWASVGGEPVESDDQFSQEFQTDDSYVRAYATSQDDKTRYGEPIKIDVITPENPFTVYTDKASSITPNSAVLHGNISTNEQNLSTITERGFEYQSEGDQKPFTVFDESNNTTLSIKCNIDGLSPFTKYTFRAFAKYKGDIQYGQKVSFTTQPSDVDYLTVEPEYLIFYSDGQPSDTDTFDVFSNGQWTVNINDN